MGKPRVHHSAQDIEFLADAYADLGRWEEAARTYRAAINLEPASADLYNSLATVDEELDDATGAQEVYHKAIELRPEDPLPYYNLRLLYEEHQRTEEAVQALEKCLQCATDPDERSAVRDRLIQLQTEHELELFDIRRAGWFNRKWRLQLELQRHRPQRPQDTHVQA
jgi:tetratricopeptide (TPR) repeat protein